MRIYTIIPILLLGACNSMYVKPNTMEQGQVVYTQRGGYSMKRSIKEHMEDRGYIVRVGKAKAGRSLGADGGEFDSIDYDINEVPANTRYVVKVVERREIFMPYWCTFNGFWWWNFNVSIADQKNGEEIMTWRGRGCATSSLQKLDRALDELEKK